MTLLRFYNTLVNRREDATGGLDCQSTAEVSGGQLRFREGPLVSFQRTLRVPETEKQYPLPPGMGRFELVRAGDCPGLPAEMERRGGVVLLMYQKEAMWISLAGGGAALKLGLGMVNAVDGKAFVSGSLGVRGQDYCPGPQGAVKRY
jgi:hypothetical protein